MSTIEAIARYESTTRYYRVIAGRDLLGDYTLIRVWGGKGSKRGGYCIETCASHADVERRAGEIARRRKRRGYCLM